VVRVKATARTWNANESGLLWERLWKVEDDGTCLSMTFAPGVFVPPARYASESAFWKAYDEEAAEFHGWFRGERRDVSE
jgi:hypothetical protein